MPKPITDHQLATLRARLNVILELSRQGGDETRASCATRLHDAITDWEQENRGRTTQRTLTDEQIHGLRAAMPWRGILFDAALAGNERARVQCAYWLTEEEEAAQQRRNRDSAQLT